MPNSKAKEMVKAAERALPDRRGPGGGGGGITGNGGGGNIGNVAHEPTPRLRAKVELLCALGNSREAIAFACDFSTDTLDKYYGDELARGKVRIRERLGAAIMQTACGEDVPCPTCEGEGIVDRDKGNKAKICPECKGSCHVWIREPNPTAQVWASKNLMGWSDKARIEHTGDGGGPIVTEQRDAGGTIQQRLRAIRERQQAANDKAA